MRIGRNAIDATLGVVLAGSWCVYCGVMAWEILSGTKAANEHTQSIEVSSQAVVTTAKLDLKEAECWQDEARKSIGQPVIEDQFCQALIGVGAAR